MTGSAYLSSVLCHTPTAAQQVDWLTSFGHSDKSPELEAFCQQYNASPPAEIHALFLNIDCITAIIQKQCLLSYPAGQYFNRVIYLYNTSHFIQVSTLNCLLIL
jgi:hypothetical protein